MSRILITGLPGCGMDRWFSAQPPELQREMVCVPWGELLPAGEPVWLLVDLRGDPERLIPAMGTVPRQADAVIGLHAEQLSLEQQARWRQALPGLHFCHHLRMPFRDRLPRVSRRDVSIQPVLPALQTICFQMPQVVLDHLQFALTGLENGMGVRFWRIRGRVETLEYAHPVAVEGSLAGLFVHPAETVSDVLIIRGEGLDAVPLQDALQAAAVPGQPAVRGVACPETG